VQLLMPVTVTTVALVGKSTSTLGLLYHSGPDVLVILDPLIVKLGQFVANVRPVPFEVMID
jgi:hypothetical protein